jgi:hypothetical protein
MSNLVSAHPDDEEIEENVYEENAREENADDDDDSENAE